jgi:diguanylate cyclase (GGDEF)-like protein/PAS domain S-box-containing protein
LLNRAWQNWQGALVLTEMFDSPPTGVERLRRLLSAPVSVLMHGLASWRSLHVQVSLLMLVAVLSGGLIGVWQAEVTLSRELLEQAPPAPRSSIGAEDVPTLATESSSGRRVWRVNPRVDVFTPPDPVRTGLPVRLLAWALLLTGLLVAVLLWLLRPLRHLERQAKQLLAGDPGVEMSQVLHGEVGQLARILNHVWAERTQVEGFNTDLLHKLGSVMAAAPVGLAFTRQQRFELVSVEFCRLLGRSEDELLGQAAQFIFASDQDYQTVGPLVRAAFAAEQPYRGDWQLRRRDGMVFWGRLQARPVHVNDPGAGTIWSLEDVSDLLLLHRQLEHAAAHDPLTGLYNRKGFEQVLASVFTGQPHSHPAALLMIDLDKFKPINDSAGHAAGDAMLQAVARALMSHVRLGDTVARLGGDEFAVILPNCQADAARPVAEKLVQAVVDQRVNWEGRILNVGASIGVAGLQTGHDSPSIWLADADAACYEAKRRGRGTVVMASVRPQQLDTQHLAAAVEA